MSSVKWDAAFLIRAVMKFRRRKWDFDEEKEIERREIKCFVNLDLSVRGLDSHHPG